MCTKHHTYIPHNNRIIVEAGLYETHITCKNTVTLLQIHRLSVGAGKKIKQKRVKN